MLQHLCDSCRYKQELGVSFSSVSAFCVCRDSEDKRTQERISVMESKFFLTQTHKICFFFKEVWGLSGELQRYNDAATK